MQFIHDLYLHIVEINLTLNNKTDGSEYNVENLEDSIKADWDFFPPKNAITVVSDMKKTDTKVENDLTEYAE